MRSPVEQFFNSLAPKWDEYANDNLGRVATLFGRLGIQQGDRVLDLACGTGVVTGLLHEFSNAPVHGLDIASNMIEIAKDKYEGQDYASFEVGDFLDYEGGRYDFIVIYNAYPHFVDRDAFALALEKHLNPSGKFAIVHSLGRAQLSRHHENLGPQISRDLLPANEEARFYQDRFDVLIADEGDDFYLIEGCIKTPKR